MKTLVVEDDRISRLLIQEFLREYGVSRVAVNGMEAVEAVDKALDENLPFDLICLDIMMPGMDGQQALKAIRDLEASRPLGSGKRAKIVMTTALGDLKNVSLAYQGLCDAYLVKPIQKAQLLVELRNLGLIE